MNFKAYLIYFLLFISAISNNLFATNVNLHSLINANSAEDSSYYDVFLHYRVQNIDSALKYAKLSVTQSGALKDTLELIKSFNALGYSYEVTLEFDSALYIYRKGLNLSKKINNEVRQIYFFNSIGVIYDNSSRYDSAIANFYSCLQLARKLDREKDVAIALNNIGNINFDINNLNTAIDFYLQSAEIKERNNYPGLDLVFNNIGLCYSSLDEYESGIEYFSKTLNICNTNGCSSQRLDQVLIGLATCYFGLKDYEFAQVYVNQVLESDESQNQLAALRIKSDLEYVNANYSQALSYINSSIDLAKQIKNQQSLKINYEKKSKILNSMGEPDSALLYLQFHYAVKDSLFNETVAKSIQDLFVGIEIAQAEATIQDKEREISIRKRTNILFALVIILSIAIIIKSIMDLTKRKKMNKYLDKQVALKTSELTESNKHLHEKSKDLNDLIYNISHEIRGPLARLLGLINLGQMESHKELQEVKYYGKLQNEVIELESILKRMTITNYVNHHEVNIVGIKPDEFFEKLFANSRYLWQDKIKINLDLDGIGKLTTDREMLEIALQNIIANAVKFRNPRNPDDPILTIKLEKGKKDRIDIIMLDNGIGFDEKYKESITDLFFVASELGGVGIGLHQTKLALTKINAEFEIRSTRNPTTFVVHL